MTSGPSEPNDDPPPPYGPPYGPPTPYGPPSPYGQQPPPPYGQQPPYGYPAPGYVVTPPNDGLALGAMVVGIVSIVLTCGYGIGLLGSPAALIMGRISLNRIGRSQGRLGGRSMAMAGFVLGIIGTVLLVLALVAIVVVIVLAGNGTIGDGSSNV